MVGKYPRFDYSDWIGQKISVFGTKVVVANKMVTVYLQLDPNVANKVWEMIEALPQVSLIYFPLIKLIINK